jgi:hypothetical protein
MLIFCEECGEKLNVENGLYLSQSTEGALMGGAQFLRNKNYLLITPMLNGETVPYIYTATMSKIRIEGGGGSIEITFARDGGMRFRTEKLEIRLTAKMGFGDVAMMHDTAVQVDMDGAVYYMVPTKGSVMVDSHYNCLHIATQIQLLILQQKMTD